jgi:hypothetical protein
MEVVFLLTICSYSHRRSHPTTPEKEEKKKKKNTACRVTLLKEIFKN